MLCNICWGMLRGQIGRQWKGSYDLHFSHHESVKGLKASHDMGCGVCRVLFDKLVQKFGKSPEELTQWLDHDRKKEEEYRQGSVDRVADSEDSGMQTEFGQFHSSALLAVVHDFEQQEVFRLDFKLEWGLGPSAELVGERTFVLQQTGKGFMTPRHKSW